MVRYRRHVSERELLALLSARKFADKLDSPDWNPGSQNGILHE
jgi:hypothetical protein